MQTSENRFERILQEVLRQKQILEDLEAENQDLQRQLANLRAGQGVFIDILGQRFALNTLIGSAHTTGIGEVQPASSEAVSENEVFTTAHSDEASGAEPHPASTPFSPNGDESEDKTPTEKTRTLVKVAAEPADPPAPAAPAGFLEELLLDEFTTATTSQIAAWSGPTTTHSESAMINEEEKAALRRELMGSFLLE